MVSKQNIRLSKAGLFRHLDKYMQDKPCNRNDEVVTVQFLKSDIFDSCLYQTCIGKEKVMN